MTTLPYTELTTATPPSRVIKLCRLVAAQDRVDRSTALLENQLNLVLPGGRGGVRGGCSYEDFVASVGSFDGALAALLEVSGQQRVWRVFERFRQQAEELEPLPFPVAFNADSSLAEVCYALVRRLEPTHVLETGVGYGITTGVILSALDENGGGSLTSIDLPSLGDPRGEHIGLAVPPPMRERWSYRRGSSRRLLPEVLRELGHVDFFLGDSANVASLQRFEWRQVLARLGPGGAAVFNNVARRFVGQLLATPGYRTWIVRQREKQSCFTAVILAEPDCEG